MDHIFNFGCHKYPLAPHAVKYTHKWYKLMEARGRSEMSKADLRTLTTTFWPEDSIRSIACPHVRPRQFLPFTVNSTSPSLNPASSAWPRLRTCNMHYWFTSQNAATVRRSVYARLCIHSFTCAYLRRWQLSLISSSSSSSSLLFSSSMIYVHKKLVKTQLARHNGLKEHLQLP